MFSALGRLRQRVARRNLVSLESLRGARKRGTPDWSIGIRCFVAQRVGQDLQSHHVLLHSRGHGDCEHLEQVVRETESRKPLLCHALQTSQMPTTVMTTSPSGKSPFVSLGTGQLKAWSLGPGHGFRFSCNPDLLVGPWRRLATRARA